MERYLTKSYSVRLADKVSANTLRRLINLWPPYWGAGIKVIKITEDYRKIEVAMKLKWFNTNLVGTHFGGSIYAMTDPFYMLILLKNLGKQYIVWDKAAYIDFKKPGRGTLHATFTLSTEEIDKIRQHADQQAKYIFDLSIDVIDQQGEVVASIVKTLYVRRKHQE